MLYYSSNFDEDVLCRILRCYTEEWGPDRIEVIVPASWSCYSADFGRVNLTYAGEGFIIIKTPAYEYKVEVTTYGEEEKI